MICFVILDSMEDFSTMYALVFPVTKRQGKIVPNNDCLAIVTYGGVWSGLGKFNAISAMVQFPRHILSQLVGRAFTIIPEKR